VYADCSCNAAGKKTLPYYFIGIGVLLAYLPMYWYRKRYEDKRPSATAPADNQAAVMAAPGAGP